ncbi:MAG: NADH-quinone oxidoreductase subunit L [Rhizomicrobium sp.]
MSDALIWFFAAGQLALALLGLMPDSLLSDPQAVARSARNAALLCLILAVAALGLVLLKGSARTPMGGGFAGLQFDALSSSIEVLVAFIGVIVVDFSRNYLDGDPRHSDFLKRLCLTLAAVLHLIVAADLPQFALAWIATSLCLHRLLVFYGERQPAILAARKKFVVARLSDVSLALAFLILAHSFGTTDIAHILSAARRLPHGAGSGGLTLAALLLGLAALLKSAQFPMHGWLLEVMETPTPVSALLHAGIINAGGFLVLRFAPVFSHAAGALDLLLLVGGITALFGGLVMLTQTSIKVSLAYSTIGQMGFMMLECGLGAFAAAWIHIIGHSLYKAHAFLSAGSGATPAAGRVETGPRRAPTPLAYGAALSLGLVIVVSTGALFGVSPTMAPGLLIIASIAVLSLTHLFSSAAPSFSPRLIVQLAIRAVVVALAVFALEALAAHLLRPTLTPYLPLRGPVEAVLAGLILAGFAMALLLQNSAIEAPRANALRALYVHLANGLYVNTLANRWAITLWPGAVPPPRTNTANLP